jgi:hypothetical protein
MLNADSKFIYDGSLFFFLRIYKRAWTVWHARNRAMNFCTQSLREKRDITGRKFPNQIATSSEVMEYKEDLNRNSILLFFHSPQWARTSSLSRRHDHTQTHHIRYDSSGRVISPTQRPLRDNAQHLQESDIHATGGMRTRNPGKQVAPNPRLGHRAATGIDSILVHNKKIFCDFGIYCRSPERGWTSRYSY